ncbi:putative beta-lactamase domain-containing protein [Candidatus Nitrososphaera gargensis Ga9.2]|uniref:Putative beta-lactamase domain-containing protein n=1 Tax=Nitrososphaera gargensis (strain Ga9.2) TaxID=1237085 RepID=K0IM20_NITGG|nr:putative beta-lactamase domain-containing protein [Candidatus Nitrososphaera gargensis Ga9.2]
MQQPSKLLFAQLALSHSMRLLPVSKMSITLLMDNVTDRLLASSPHAHRPPLGRDGKFLPAPLAEHGFSALIEIQYGGEDGGSVQQQKTYLFDTGTSENGVIFNSDLFGIDLLKIDAIVLSHGHFDHFTGLQSVLKRISRPVRLYAHPDAFLRRWDIFPDGTRLINPVLDEAALKEYGSIIHKNEGPTGLPDEKDPRLIISGQIPRETSYEKGFPPQYAEVEGKGLVHDPLVKDDQALIAKVKGKGLVVVSGCGHAGIINTINYARRLGGTEKIHAVLGGFHLSGRLQEEAIEPTLKDLQSADPDYIVPCHCTGWKAVNTIIQRMPEKFIPPSVGTRFVF